MGTDTEVANPELARVVSTTNFTRGALERKIADVSELIASSTILHFVDTLKGTFRKQVWEELEEVPKSVLARKQMYQRLEEERVNSGP